MQNLRLTCRRRIRVVAALFCLVAWSRSTQAETRVDWQRGILVASAAAPADLRAPNTELARVKAERIARTRCRETLHRAAGKLATASGKSVSEVLGTSFAKTQFGLIPLDFDQGSDGSVVVRMALPIDAIRAELYGSDAPLFEQVASTPLFIDARHLALAPAVGLSLQSEDVTYRGPVLFFVDEASARKDASIEKGATLVRATKMRNGVLTIAQSGIAKRFASLPLVVVLVSEGR